MKESEANLTQKNHRQREHFSTQFDKMVAEHQGKIKALEAELSALKHRYKVVDDAYQVRQKENEKLLDTKEKLMKHNRRFKADLQDKKEIIELLSKECDSSQHQVKQAKNKIRILKEMLKEFTEASDENAQVASDTLLLHGLAELKGAEAALDEMPEREKILKEIEKERLDAKYAKEQADREAGIVRELPGEVVYELSEIDRWTDMTGYDAHLRAMLGPLKRDRQTQISPKATRQRKM